MVPPKKGSSWWPAMLPYNRALIGNVFARVAATVARTCDGGALCC